MIECVICQLGKHLCISYLFTTYRHIPEKQNVHCTLQQHLKLRKVSLLFLSISYGVKMPQNIKAAAVCFVSSGDTCHTMWNLPYSDIRLMVLIQNCDTEWNTRLHVFFTVFFYISTSFINGARFFTTHIRSLKCWTLNILILNEDILWNFVNT